MSLLTYLLSGMGPESENFIYNYVEQFTFNNFDDKNKIFYQFKELFAITLKQNNVRKNNVFDMSKNEMPTSEYNLINTNAKTIIVVWNFSQYIGEKQEKDKHVMSSVFENTKKTLSNIDVMTLLYESYNNSVKSSVIEHTNSQFFRGFYYVLNGIDIIETNNELYIYPHFIVNVSEHLYEK